MLDKNLKKRILEIAFEKKIGHLGSFFSSVDIIDYVFGNKMHHNDIFILSSGHAALALYVCLEKYKGVDAKKLFEKHGGHPHLDEENHLFCSTGSLGLGINVAIGRALGNKDRTVHVLLSDGECAEGSVWEALKTIYEQNIPNIRVYVNINGFAAYDEVNVDYLSNRISSFLPSTHLFYTSVEQFPFLKGLNAHYHVMSEEDYKLGLQILSE